jgi:hypothetical protein
VSAAHIVLEDVDGAIAVKCTFTGAEGGGLNVASPAHQHAQILIGMMDKLCTQQGEPVITPVANQG